MVRLMTSLFCPLFILSGILHGQSVTILYTNNNNGNISFCDCGDEPKGGLARRKALFDQIRLKEKNVLAVDAGDFLNAFGFNRKQDSLTVILYDKLAYDAINIGEQEFSNGLEFFYRRIKLSSLPLISSTLFFSDSLITQPWLIKKTGSIRFGIIGYTPASSFRYLPNKNSIHIVIIGEKEKLQANVSHLKTKSDIIIVLSQAGYEEDLQLATSIQGIDIIIGGHTQMEINENLKRGNTIITQAGGNGEWVGRLKLTFQNKRILSFENNLLPLDSKIREDNTIKNTVEAFIKK